MTLILVNHIVTVKSISLLFDFKSHVNIDCVNDLVCIDFHRNIHFPNHLSYIEAQEVEIQILYFIISNDH